MSKSRVLLVLTVVVLLVSMLAMVIPGAASADIYPDNWQWANANYQGTDSYYGGGWYVEYVSGSTARLEVMIGNYGNYEWGNASLVSAVLTTDWNAQINATSLPTELDYGKTAMVSFEFTVPSTSVASNLWTHSWEIVFQWRTEGYTYQVNWTPYEWLGTGNGVNVYFHLGTYGSWDYNSYLATWQPRPIVPDSDSLYLVDTTAGTITPVARTAYKLTDTTGEVEFLTTPPGIGVRVYASYTYTDFLGQGDGTNPVFWTEDDPIAPGTANVFLFNTVTNAYAEVADADYTVDADTGKITLKTAPAPWDMVYASYQINGSSEWNGTWGGNNFVVLSQDQADARIAGQQYDVIKSGFYPDSADGQAGKLTAAMHAQTGMDAWNSGNFATAKVEMQAALAAIQAAGLAELAYQKVWESQDLLSDNADIILTQANAAYYNGYGGYFTAQAAYYNAMAARMNAQKDAEIALLDAQAKEAKGHGAMWSNLGVFTILVGVAIVLGAIGFILWAFSRLTEAKRPQQPG